MKSFILHPSSFFRHNHTVTQSLCSSMIDSISLLTSLPQSPILQFLRVLTAAMVLSSGSGGLSEWAAIGPEERVHQCIHPITALEIAAIMESGRSSGEKNWRSVLSSSQLAAHSIYLLSGLCVTWAVEPQLWGCFTRELVDDMIKPHSSSFFFSLFLLIHTEREKISLRFNFTL